MALSFLSRSRQVCDLGDGFSIWRIGADRLVEFSQTVFEVYNDVYADRAGWEPAIEDFRHIVREDVFLQDSSLYLAAVHGDEIVATARSTRRDPGVRFAVETEFGVDLEQLTSEHRAGAIYHVGRTAIHKRRLATLRASRRQSGRLLQTLYSLGFGLLEAAPDTLFVGELDEVAVTIFRRWLGLPVTELGPAREYLGSPTLPVLLHARDLPDAWRTAGAAARAALV